MIKLRHDELQKVSEFAVQHPLGRTLSEMKNWKFQIGDVVVRLIKSDAGVPIVTDMVSETCQVPRKYRVMFIDELGVPWVKQLSVRGGLGSKLYCLAMVDAGRYHYQVDPEQLEAILLNFKYDPRAEYRRMRENNAEYGVIKNETE